MGVLLRFIKKAVPGTGRFSVEPEENPTSREAD